MIMKKKYCFAILSLLVLSQLWNYSYAQDELHDVYDLDLAQLSKLKIISASKVKQDVNEVPSTVYVISSEQIRDNGYFTLDEVLSNLPGFQFRNPLGFNSYVFIRGVPNQNNYTLVLIDGVQVNELNSGGFYAGGIYNLSNIDRIEVIYGPASVVYGTNAISGIINIITKDYEKKEVEARLLAGSFNTYSGDFRASFVNRDKSFRVNLSGMVKNSEKANLKGEAGDNNWTDLMENFENDYALDLKVTAKSFVFATNFLQKQSSASTFNKSIGSIYRDYGTLWNIRFVNSYLKFNKEITAHFSYSFSLYNRNATVLPNTIFFVTDTAQIGYYRPNNLTGIENIGILKFSKNFSLVSGLAFEYERLAERYSISVSNSTYQKPEKPEKPQMLNNFLASIYIQPQLVVGKNLFLSGGVRFDHSSVYHQVLTPRVGVSYNLKTIIFRFSYADAFRAPKPWDYTDGFGNDNLRPEKMRSFEFSTSFSLYQKFGVKLIGYKNYLSDAIRIEYLTEGYRWANWGKVITNGLEIGLSQLMGKIKPQFNYTFSHSVDELGNEVPEISKHTANAGITYSYSRYLKLNIRANYLGKRENPTVITTTNSKFISSCVVFHGSLSLLNYKNFTAQLLVKIFLIKSTIILQTELLKGIDNRSVQLCFLWVI